MPTIDKFYFDYSKQELEERYFLYEDEIKNVKSIKIISSCPILKWWSTQDQNGNILSMETYYPCYFKIEK
ncbi:MAG: hypothetical protein AABY22_33670 [Nanoarchaeota archaeon]